MKLFCITFSPTGGTKAAAALLCGAVCPDYASFELCEPEKALALPDLTADDLCVIAAPSFGGRIPAMASRRIAALRGNGARAVVMAVYGNRAQENTLAELKAVAETAGFAVCAGVEAVAEHSIVRHIAQNRPDDADKARLEAFGRQIREALDNASLTPDVQLPGTAPETPGANSFMPIAPGADCMRCGRCAARCPAQAIDPADVTKVNAEACIGCMRCIAVCPRKTRQLDPARYAAIDAKLSELCALRRECILYPDRSVQ